jgi:hypothetical protein
VSRNQIGALVNMFFPGFGYLLVGEMGSFLLYVTCMALAVVLSVFVIGIPLLFGIWIYGIYDLAKRDNL